MEVNRGLPARLLVKYFENEGRTWRVKPEVRRLTDFRQLNLLEPWTRYPQADVIFLRNVLIYFDLKTRRQILDGMYRRLATDGVLFLGTAETTSNVDRRWEAVTAGRTTYFRKSR